MVNLVILLGRLGRDPDLRHTKQGHSVVSMSVATERTFIDELGKDQKETEWHSVLAWHTLAEACQQHLKKGSLVYVQGRLHTRDWEDDQHVKHRKTEVIAEIVQFLDRSGKPLRHLPQEDLPL